MKLRQSFSAVIIVLMACLVILSQSNESPLPVPTGMVNDFANIIDDATQAQIEQKLRDFKAKTNPQVEIAVVTVQTTGGRPIFDYSLALARGWKIGSKENDNPSLLLLIAVDDKKYFAQISRDLEDELTDGIAGQLHRQYLVPAFRAGNYTKGISDTVDAYIRTIEERKSAPNASPTPKQSSTEKYGIGSSTIFCCLIGFILLVIVIIIISRFGGGSGGGGSRRDRDRWRSGGFGGNDTFIPPVIVWGGGSDGGGSSDWGNSGGDSWGGFGGGGDFGGGGAGGDW
jgi:uncharacterized protein